MALCSLLAGPLLTHQSRRVSAGLHEKAVDQYFARFADRHDILRSVAEANVTDVVRSRMVLYEGKGISLASVLRELKRPTKVRWGAYKVEVHAHHTAQPCVRRPRCVCRACRAGPMRCVQRTSAVTALLPRLRFRTSAARCCAAAPAPQVEMMLLRNAYDTLTPTHCRHVLLIYKCTFHPLEARKGPARATTFVYHEVEFTFAPTIQFDQTCAAPTHRCTDAPPLTHLRITCHMRTLPHARCYTHTLTTGTSPCTAHAQPYNMTS
jgi:hypothetical protein